MASDAERVLAQQQIDIVDRCCTPLVWLWWLLSRCGPLALLIYIALCVSGRPHDHWINRGGYKSPIDGAYCCGEHDCFVIPPDQIKYIVAAGKNGESGYVWRREVADALGESVAEFIPDSEVMASRDGQYWRCKKPDGSRRCFFAPPPSI